jgi:nucleoside-diphosphate-sugar epimerase
MFSILGASGSIGKSLGHALRRSGVKTYEPAREDMAIYERDLGDVVYCVGLTADFRSRPFETVDAHVGLLRSMLERATFSSFLYLSSTRVYRGLQVGREEVPLLVDPANPEEIYNASKVLGEILCLSQARETVRVVRLSNVIGPYATSPSFARSIVADAVDRGVIELESHLDSAKNYVDIRDVVDIIPQIVATGRARLYNIAGANSTTHREFVALIQRATNCTIIERPGMPLKEFPPIAIDRISREFDFVPRPVGESLTDMVSEYRQSSASIAGNQASQ